MHRVTFITMGLRRLWSSWIPAQIRKAHPLIVFTIIIIIMVVLITLMYGLNTEKIFISKDLNVCFEDESFQRSHLLNASARVRIIPSTPRGQPGMDQDTDNSFNKELESRCISIPGLGSKSSHNLIICTYDPEKDQVVSGYLKKHGTWEAEHVMNLLKVQSLYPDIMFIDLGCNIGVFTLPAAQLGMDVIAVDAMSSSLNLLQKSLLYNGLSCRVTLIHNALYRQHRPMRIARDPYNIGGSRVVEPLASRADKVAPSDLVDAICLDDLVPLVKGREVFVKIDLEASEDAVFECAHKFFSQVDVKVVLIEWIYFRHKEKEARAIIGFLLDHKMRPTWDLDQNFQIDVQAASSWPDNVYWMKLG